MKNQQRLEQLRELMVEVTASLTSAALSAAEMQALLDADEQAGTEVQPDRTPAPHVNPATFYIEWQGRSCFLGSTVTFRLFAVLARRPNRFVSHRQLLVEVWSGDVKSVQTIRSVVRHLRDKLRIARMGKLADAIVGHGEAYCLTLRGMK